MSEHNPGRLVEQVRELVELVHATSVRSLRVESGAFRVEIENALPAVAAQALAVTDAAPPAVAVPAATPAAPANPVNPVAPAAPAGTEVRAPLVGVFYRRPAPGEPPFVDVGTPVEKGRQLGIVEAMKMMNPVTADRAGVVLEILAEDGDVVEYDQPMFLLGAG
ncbi:acetyl-CoA carboxylase biotin carboxyl carrier protein [Streptosporangium pseudovulgare]|uniref:Biotin carboxyl carrier protein of acetyl-CoA carboxylase n=1 Tax=Streptosporangium pseudovulgare TaxID=35765 RepID=A0ABQ2R301_9ACTN|nr:acetyl-CoA carboxylase biotin carboxyl carrier protein [Streptosporangium pseudovulgare]GGQ06495.1 hypothetical protein GCM10010140_40800 [Streptosporangium pseudovulgare]